MVSIDKLTYKLRQLDDFLATLGKVKDTPREIFLNDQITIGAAKYYLQVSIECCLDIASHIIAAEDLRAPADYADCFNVLEENGILDAPFAHKLRQMAKFRNRLVHLYGEIDDAYVLQFVKNDLKDIIRFKNTIARRYLSSHPSSPTPAD